MQGAEVFLISPNLQGDRPVPGDIRCDVSGFSFIHGESFDILEGDPGALEFLYFVVTMSDVDDEEWDIDDEGGVQGDGGIGVHKI